MASLMDWWVVIATAAWAMEASADSGAWSTARLSLPHHKLAIQNQCISESHGRIRVSVYCNILFNLWPFKTALCAPGLRLELVDFWELLIVGGGLACCFTLVIAILAQAQQRCIVQGQSTLALAMGQTWASYNYCIDMTAFRMTSDDRLAELPLLTEAHWAKRFGRARARFAETPFEIFRNGFKYVRVGVWEDMTRNFDQAVGQGVGVGDVTIERLDLGPEVTIWGPFLHDNEYHAIVSEVDRSNRRSPDPTVTFEVLSFAEATDTWLDDILAALSHDRRILHHRDTGMPVAAVWAEKERALQYRNMPYDLHKALQCFGFVDTTLSDFVQAAFPHGLFGADPAGYIAGLTREPAKGIDGARSRSHSPRCRTSPQSFSEESIADRAARPRGRAHPPDGGTKTSKGAGKASQHLSHGASSRSAQDDSQAQPGVPVKRDSLGGASIIRQP